MLMDHVLETLETDLKYTVFLVCEDVVDLHPQTDKSESSEMIVPDEQGKSGNAEASEDAAGDAAATTAATSSLETEDTKPLTKISTEPIAFLDGTEDWYRFQSQLSEGDSIPRCDATLLRMPVSKRDMEKEKKAAKKALKMKIKKHKKITGGTSTSYGLPIGGACISTSQPLTSPCNRARV